MKALGVCIALLLLLALPVLSGPSDFRLVDQEHRIVSGPDADGDLEISFRVTVKSLRDKELSIRVIAQGIDQEDFVVYDAYLETNLKPNEERVLRDLQFIPQTSPPRRRLRRNVDRYALVFEDGLVIDVGQS